MSTVLTRYLEPKDIPALIVLEQSKWEPHQAADGAVMLERILAYPELCVGAFCPHSGRALASAFMRPVVPAMFSAPTRWEIAADVKNTYCTSDQSRSLFGISLSSTSGGAVDAISEFFFPRALKVGWHDIYLGSPIPGFRKARQKNPSLSVWQYVHAKRNPYTDEPFDPQLRYYFRKGFRHIVSIQENYFPHADSIDHGVILRAVIPVSRPRPLWQATPWRFRNWLLTMMSGPGRY